MTTEWIFGLENVGKPTEKRFRDRLRFYRYRYAVGRVAEVLMSEKLLKYGGISMKMKKLLTIIVAVVMIVSCVACLTACKKKTYEIAVVTDVGQLMDGGFNQGTYEGAKAYAEANKKTYQYYQPANGSDATDNDRIEAMNKAIANGAKIIVAPGFLQADAMTAVATENPDVKFIYDGRWFTASAGQYGNGLNGGSR